MELGAEWPGQSWVQVPLRSANAPFRLVWASRLLTWPGSRFGSAPVSNRPEFIAGKTPLHPSGGGPTTRVTSEGPTAFGPFCKPWSDSVTNGGNYIT